MMVAARTIQPPHCKCGTKRRTSTKKARRETRRVGSRRIRTPRRYRGEWEGEWKWAATERPKQTKVRKAAMGWTMRREVKERRMLEGRLKSLSLPDFPKTSSVQEYKVSGDSLSGPERETEGDDHTGRIAYGEVTAFGARSLAVAQNSIVDAVERSQGNRLDHGCGQDGEQQQGEGREEQKGQGSGWLQQHHGESGISRRGRRASPQHERD